MLFKYKPTWTYERKPKRASAGHMYSSMTIYLKHPSCPGVEIPIELTQNQREHLEKWFDVQDEQRK